MSTIGFPMIRQQAQRLLYSFATTAALLTSSVPHVADGQTVNSRTMPPSSGAVESPSQDSNSSTHPPMGPLSASTIEARRLIPSTRFPQFVGAKEYAGGLPPACASVLKDSLFKLETPDNLPGQFLGTIMQADFKPGLNLTLSQAAAACGFSNFAWVQVIISAPPIWGPTPRFDCPQENLNNVGCPYYYSSKILNDESVYGQSVITNTEYHFYDQPMPLIPEAYFKKGQSVKFMTSLVGILKDSTWQNPSYDPLYIWAWETNWNGKTAPGTKICPTPLECYFRPDIGGGITYIKVLQDFKTLSAIRPANSYESASNSGNAQPTPK